ncbi:MAG: SAM-dependent methyltransferase [Anaerolineae bacterium]|nr:SAM-dependent methyltransferase [Anaerolineae bacterium]
MNFKENESATKLRGGYYTDPEIAYFLLRWVLQIRPQSILEPSCGDGVFIRSLSCLGTDSVNSFTGFEIDPIEATKSRDVATLLRNVNSEIYTEDFLGWSLLQFMQPPMFDAVVGNPPFIRYQYMESNLQARSQKIFESFQLPFTMHTNAWVPFVISSIALLRPGGRLAMVVPAELLHVLHAQSLRTYLTRQCSRVLIFDPEELWFENTLQGAILLLAEKKVEPESRFLGVGIIPTRTKSFLQEDPETYFCHADYANGETVAGKWMLAFLTKREREILREAIHRPGVYRFNEIAEVAVGIVTGANKFFLVPNNVVQQYGLENWAYPMFGRSEHAPGVIYDETTHWKNQELGLPTNFIWFTNERIPELPQTVQNYLKLGEAQEIHKRYKCRIREPWYSVPSVYSTSIGMLKRCHDFPRLILNKVEAFTTDTAYRVQSKQFNPASLVFSFVNSLTALSAELEGRHYGGGVLELVPSEVRKLIVPICDVEERVTYHLDSTIRTGIAPETLLAMQDNTILKQIGFDSHDCDDLRTAWMRLRSRRQRVETALEDED